MAFDKAHRLIDRVADLPGIRGWRRRRHEQRFRERLGHAFSGVYPTFAAAAAAVPEGLPGDYDNEAAAGMYVDRLQVDDHDRPALFWLLEALAAGARRICDLGGSTGIKYYAFTPLLTPFLAPGSAVNWHVIEVPAAAELGARIAAQRGVGQQLTFGSEVAAASGCDVLFVSGALQYLPQSLGQILGALADKPRRVLINTTPIHASRSYFTLNNIGTACCPYRVTARDEFVEEVRSQGYLLRDHWQNLGKRLDLPFEAGLTIEHYSGFCFDRQG